MLSYDFRTIGDARYVTKNVQPYHIRVNIGLPINRSLLSPLCSRPIELEEAWFYHEHTSIPLLEYLFGGHTLQHHSAQHFVHSEERRQIRHVPRMHDMHQSYMASAGV